MSTEIELAKYLWELKQHKQELAAATKEANAKIEKAEYELIDLLVEEGKKDTGKIAGVGKFTIAREHHPSVTSSNMPTFINSIRDTETFNLVKETIAANTLKKHLKERIADRSDYFMDNEEEFDRVLATLPEDMEPTINNAVKYELSLVGVQMFDKVILRHTDKGKA